MVVGRPATGVVISDDKDKKLTYKSCNVDQKEIGEVLPPPDLSIISGNGHLFGWNMMNAE
jgi:hypothetical protein